MKIVRRNFFELARRTMTYYLVRMGSVLSIPPSSHTTSEILSMLKCNTCKGGMHERVEMILHGLIALIHDNETHDPSKQIPAGDHRFTTWLSNRSRPRLTPHQLQLAICHVIQLVNEAMCSWEVDENERPFSLDDMVTFQKIQRMAATESFALPDAEVSFDAERMNATSRATLLTSIRKQEPLTAEIGYRSSVQESWQDNPDFDELLACQLMVAWNGAAVASQKTGVFVALSCL